MEQNKVGKLIQKLRREQKITQQELGDKLGVSPKTISKWETGGGLPDISFLKKISEIFDITIEELLEGKLKKRRNKYQKNNKIIIVVTFIFIILLSIIILIFSTQNKKIDDINNCTVIRTYYIDNIRKSNDDKYLYITIHEYQIEGTYTLKLSKLVSSNLEVGNSYEFTFKTNKEYISTTTDKLFKNSEVINLNHTDKIGNEQTNTYYCD